MHLPSLPDLAFHTKGEVSAPVGTLSSRVQEQRVSVREIASVSRLLTVTVGILISQGRDNRGRKIILQLGPTVTVISCGHGRRTRGGARGRTVDRMKEERGGGGVGGSH